MFDEHMHTRLIVIGASGHGKVVADIAMCLKKYDRIVFLDDDDSKRGCFGLPIVGKSADANFYIGDSDFCVAIGDPRIRQRKLEKLEAMSAVVPALIHPKAVIGTGVQIGNGTVVMAGVVINTAVKVGKGCIINTASSIDHDNIIHDYAHISVGAHLAGTVEIGERTWIGTGAVVSNNIYITTDCMIGAGAVVVKNIEESGTYIGVPARRFLRE